MFRKMRRFGQQIPENEAIELLQSATCGVLALRGDEDYPYAVPMSYACLPGKIVFHCAAAGHKLDAVRAHEKASFCVVTQDDVHPRDYTTQFVSVVAFGRIRVAEDEAEKREALWALAERYVPGMPVESEKHISEAFARTRVLVLDIEHMTGKECREMMVRRKNAAKNAERA